MKSKFFNKQGEIIQYHRPSSIWTGIKDVIPEILSRSQWSIGNGISIDLWRQNWLGTHSLKDMLQLSSADIANFKSKVGSIVYTSTLLIPPQLHEVLVEAGLDSNNVLKDEDSEPDTLIWSPMINGKFSVKSAYSKIRETRNEAAWAKFIWKAYIHPRVSAQAWKIIRNGVASDSRAQSIGVSLASICRVCKGGEDSIGAENYFFAECLAILTAMEVAAARGWTKLWVETDSQAALGAFANFQVPWRLTFRWKKVKSCFTSLLLSSIWREANFSADKASKIALQKSSQELELIDGKPPWLDRVESPDCAYYRFN
ncbi:hypothetical protein FRX31_029312 [Thalictrum thalictroides]|uniref:Reverse transcriptase zinc-binding domain-containing protein n=1 Tax=Thalictrum thalictroides TaxID=46969 RepID=A0A7J6V9P7_THATH|nr:hypothetical protein FRX31_029312 [Thalictrum thalictroides]